MFKSRLISTFLFIITIILSSTCLYAEQIIILKDGTKIEGEVLSGDDFSITVVCPQEEVILKDGTRIKGRSPKGSKGDIAIKPEDKAYTFKRVDIKSIKKKMPPKEFLLPAEELYEKMKTRLSKDDPEVHYKLGLFCLQRNLDKYAVLEFNEAIKLDAKYKPKIDEQLKEILEAKAKGKYDVGMYYYNKGEYKRALEIFEKAVEVYPKTEMAEDFNQMIDLCKRQLISFPALTEEEVKERLKDRDYPLPYTVQIRKAICSYLRSISKTDDGQDELKECCLRYAELAEEYLEKAESDKDISERWRDYQIALYCYGIASWDRSLYEKLIVSMQKIRAKINENFQSKLLTPSTINELKYMEAFIKETEVNSYERITCRSLYRDIGEDYETKAKNEQILSEKRRLLNTALNCYLILVNCPLGRDEYRKIGLYGWARCFEKLEEFQG